MDWPRAADQFYFLDRYTLKLSLFFRSVPFYMFLSDRPRVAHQAAPLESEESGNIGLAALIG